MTQENEPEMTQPHRSRRMARLIATLGLALGIAWPALACGRYGPPERAIEPPPRHPAASRGQLPAHVPDVNSDETFQ